MGKQKNPNKIITKIMIILITINILIAININIKRRKEQWIFWIAHIITIG